MKKRKNLMQIFMPPRPGFWILLIVIGLFFWIRQYAKTSSKDTVESISITTLVQKIDSGLIDHIVVANSTMYSVKKGGTKESYQTDVEERMTAAQTLKTYGLSDANFKKIRIDIEKFRFSMRMLLSLLPYLPMLLLMLFYITIRLKPAWLGGGVGKKANGFNSQQKTKFSDIAGNFAAKKELLEIVQFLKNPKKYLDMGAEIPDGVLLKGPPGTGKTLLARAVAGETGVPFYYVSGSEFVEMYVGVGPARIREIFKKAKKNSPSIIFIDEIDAIGQARNGKGRNSEDDKTINQLLTEMEGFENDTNVIVIGATNNPDGLDPALLRRLSRQVFVDLPDVKDRLAILQIMVANKKLGPDVDLNVVAKRTQGLSGDSLGSLVNEAAIRAVQQDQTVINQIDLLSSIEKVLLGSADRRVVSDKEKNIIAYHEAGHAVITKIIAPNIEVQKVTIASQGKTGGFLMNASNEENLLRTSDELFNDMVIALGGHASEQIILNGVTTGASDDLMKVSKIARAMVTQYGMGGSFGKEVLFDDYSYSENLLNKVDADVRSIIEKAYLRAKSLIEDNRDFVSAVRNALIENETIELAEFAEIAERFIKSDS